MLILPIFDLSLLAIPRSLSPQMFLFCLIISDNILLMTTSFWVPFTKYQPLTKSDTWSYAIPIPFTRLHKMPPALKEKAMSSFFLIYGVPAMFRVLSLSQLPSLLEHWDILELEGNSIECDTTEKAGASWDAFPFACLDKRNSLLILQCPPRVFCLLFAFPVTPFIPCWTELFSFICAIVVFRLLVSSARPWTPWASNHVSFI